MHKVISNIRGGLFLVIGARLTDHRLYKTQRIQEQFSVLRR